MEKVFNGRFEYGVHRPTPTQVKKNVCQMNDNEKRYVMKAVNNIDVRRLVISPHLYEKMANQGITFDINIIYDTIKNFKIEDLIEVNWNKDKSTRIAFKGQKIIKVKANGRIEEGKLAFVINLKNNHIVSVWYRNLENIKKTPDLRINHDKNLDIIRLLKQYI